MAGAVKARKSGRHATSDFLEIEKQRGISVASSVMQFEYRDHVVNLLDTPGHQDFSEDTYRVLTAVDSALMVIDAAKGVEAQTIKLLDVCRMRDTPIITFMNKMDREVRDPLELLDEVESVLKIQCAPVTWPVGMGKTFRGVYTCCATRSCCSRRARKRPTARSRSSRDRQSHPGRALPAGDRTIEDGSGTGARRFASLRPAALPRRQTDAGILRLCHQQLRRARDSERAAGLGASTYRARCNCT